MWDDKQLCELCAKLCIIDFILIMIDGALMGGPAGGIFMMQSFWFFIMMFIFLEGTM